MKKITVKDKYENEYTLEYTAKTVQMLEDRGFNPEDAEAKPLTTVKTLFQGAFLANHSKDIKPSTVDEIFESLKDKDGLLTALIEMYNEPILEMMQEGNSEWKANW